MATQRRKDFDLEWMEAFEERGGVLHDLSLPTGLRSGRSLRGRGRMAILSQGGDCCAVIITAKDGRPRDEDVRACLDDSSGVVNFYTAVYF